jgi:hypothetical protein
MESHHLNRFELLMDVCVSILIEPDFFLLAYYITAGIAAAAAV